MVHTCLIGSIVPEGPSTNTNEDSEFLYGEQVFWFGPSLPRLEVFQKPRALI